MMVKFVDQAELENKRIYTNLIRAQLSSYEQALLFYNCLSSLGKNGFKPLLEKYGFFNNFQFTLLIDSGHRLYYEATAYAGQ